MLVWPRDEGETSANAQLLKRKAGAYVLPDQRLNETELFDHRHLQDKYMSWKKKGIETGVDWVLRNERSMLNASAIFKHLLQKEAPKTAERRRRLMLALTQR